MAVRWDPAQYNRYSDHRSRPFFDLVERVHADHPRKVVDLGCGPGNLTATLAERWPDADVIGLDSSPEMIAESAPIGRLSFAVADLADWVPTEDVDVLVTNAALQWVPQHPELIAAWARQLSDGAWMAVQVPGNFDSPSHQLMRELAESPRWVDSLRGVLRHNLAVLPPTDYAQLLLDAGWQADVWETTYIQVLAGEDPVLEWTRGTGLRPVLQALSSKDGAEFERKYAELLREAYPPRRYGTLFPFRRIFLVGHKP